MASKKAQAVEAHVENAAESTEEAAESTGESTTKKQPQIIKSGVLKLSGAFRVRSTDMTELRYNFDAISGDELLEVLDDHSARERARNNGDFTLRQARNLFALACEKCKDENNGLAAPDINRLGAQDSFAAAQIARLFFQTLAVGASKSFASSTPR